MKIVLDMNIFVSGLISRHNPPGKLITAWLDNKFTLVTSNAQLSEINRVFTYDRILKFINKEQIRDLKNNIDSLAYICDSIPVINKSKDPDDNSILATAIAGNADYLITGDKSDLLVLENILEIPIIKTCDAIKLIEK